MPPVRQTPSDSKKRSGAGTAKAGVGLTLLMIACCTAPALIAAGALAGIGGALGNTWVIAIAVFFLATMVTALVLRIRSGRGDCCPPEDTTRTKDREV